MMELTTVAAIVVLLSGGAGDYPMRALTAEQAAQWEQYLCPLPQEVQISGKVTVPVSALRGVVGPDATSLQAAAISEILAEIETECGVAVPIGERVPEIEQGGFIAFFTSPSMDDVEKNPDQAYRIGALSAGSGPPKIACQAQSDVGLYYAAKTLKQLLGATVKGEGEDATVDLPVCTIRDWPDMEERGQWGGSCVEDMAWLSDYKFNLIERHASIKVNKDGTSTVTYYPEFIADAKLHAVRVVPIIHHLEQLARTGLFEAYPNLRGKNARDSICFSQPEIVDIVADWLTQLGQMDGVREVMIWLSEEGKGCECDECKKNDRFVNEARACIAAWKKAKQTCPELGLRLLTTQASYKSNDKLLAAIPEGVKVSYYHGGLTYNTTRKEMIYPLLEDYVKQGRWLGVYPTICANWRITAPFSNPEFIHYRMNEFVDDGLACLVAYAVPHGHYSLVNLEAALEWSWNAKGRTPRQFAVSYATRHGIAEPDKFADWCAAISPVSWDIYGSGFPYREVYGGTDGIVRGKARLGSSIFAEFKSEERLQENIDACAAALALAQATGDDRFILETRIIDGYSKVLKAVWELSKLVQKDHVADEDREQAQAYFTLFFEGCSAVTRLYPDWSNAVAPELTGKEPGRFWDTVNTMERLATRMGALAEECGFKDPDKPYRLHVIGTWKTEEFAEAQTQVRRLDVSDFVGAPGAYLFEPKYRKGSLGLTANWAQLVSFPKDAPEDTRVEAEDRHGSHCGAWVKDGVYRLELADYDPARGYAVLAQVHGGSTTQGEFRFRKERPAE